MKNGMTIVEHGGVSVLVFSDAKQRAAIGELLVNGPPWMTRIAVAPDEATEDEIHAAVAATLAAYPLPDDHPERAP